MQGEVIDWNDERGFGFIDADGERLFFHISACRPQGVRPRVGDQVSFRAATANGRPAAVAVELPLTVLPPPRSRPRARGSLFGFRSLVGALVFAAVCGLALLVGPLRYVPLVYFAMGVATYLAYWLDKRAAEADRRRIPEVNLHLLDFCGGIVGGLFAQQVLRHKTRKPGFAAITFAIALIHLAAIAALAIPAG